MSDLIHLRVLTPEKILFEQEVEEIILPGSDGFFGVYAHHAPIVSKLEEGVIKIKDDKERIAINGGFFSLKENIATVLVN